MTLRTVLRIIAFFFCVILFRTAILSLVQHESKEKEAEAPKQRTVVQTADRGILYDRFHIPIALNKISYHAAIYYGELLEIPAIEWKKDSSGQKQKLFPRKQYVAQLSQMLAEELHMDPERIEDMIYAKASLLPHTPYILKEHLSEPEYYRLKMKEKEWRGMHASIGTERTYPFQKTASHLIGTMGLISQNQYLELVGQIRELEAALLEGEGGEWSEKFSSYQEIVQQLTQFKEKAYTAHDLVGKSGIEASMESKLRGIFGKTFYEVDVQGHLLHPLEKSRPAIAGEDLTLSLSIELQEFAEELLTQDEALREGRSIGVDPLDQKKKRQKQPWIKGGAIVVLDPRTGEILTLASTPRFNPNDFIQKNHSLHRWLETESTFQKIWDGEESLIRESFHTGQWQEESVPLSWRVYLRSLFPSETPLALFFQTMDSIKAAIQIQEDFEALLYFSPTKDPLLLFDPAARTEESAPYQQRLASALHMIPAIPDRLFAIDLCRLGVYAPAFTDPLIEKIGSMSLERYRHIEQAFHRFEQKIQALARNTFHLTTFHTWRTLHQKTFLQTLRDQEKQEQRRPRPYIDSLDQKERELFRAFWKEERMDLLLKALETETVENELLAVCRMLPTELLRELLGTFRSFEQLDRPLIGSYRRLRHWKEGQLEKDLAAAFYPMEGFGFSRSYAFQTTAPPGSLFKLVTAYAVMQDTQSAHPLHLIDEQAVGKTPSSLIVAFTPDRIPYPRFYKGGRLPKSALPSLGRLDMVSALAQSSNPYFALLAGDILKEPESLLTAARLFGFGAKTGLTLPGEAAGHLPTDLAFHRTGLYSSAIGQHTLLTTPLQTALFMAAIGNGGKRPFPQVLYGESPTFSHCALPPFIQRTLCEGLDQAIWGEKGGARPTSIRKLRDHRVWMDHFLSLKHQMIGKSGTAEISYNPYVYPSSRAQIYKHIWFGAIAFPPEGGHEPELVVIVYLRYGDSGKEAAPLASEIIQKWRAIRATHEAASDR